MAGDVASNVGAVDALAALIGQRLGPPGHQYEVLDLIGRGAQGAIYRAQQLNLPRQVALKVLDPKLATEPGFVERFHREAQAIASLEHANILPVYDFGAHEGLLYLVMRLVRGGTAKDRFVRDGSRPWAPERVLHLARQILPALDYAHRAGVIHRDIKPTNILLDGDWAYLADFGIAKVGGGLGPTLTGASVIGTPAYMAPEQVLQLPLDGRADLYAFGVVLYELLTGRVPYTADTPMLVAIQHVQATLPPARYYNPVLSEALEAVLVRALAKEREKRFATGAELALALAAAIEQAPASSTILGPAAPATPAPAGEPSPASFQPLPAPVPPYGAADPRSWPGAAAPASGAIGPAAGPALPGGSAIPGASVAPVAPVAPVAAVGSVVAAGSMAPAGSFAPADSVAPPARLGTATGAGAAADGQSAVYGTFVPGATPLTTADETGVRRRNRMLAIGGVVIAGAVVLYLFVNPFAGEQDAGRGPAGATAAAPTAYAGTTSGPATTVPTAGVTAGPAVVLFSDTFDDAAAVASQWPASPEPARYVFEPNAGEYVVRKIDLAVALVPVIKVPGTFGEASVAIDVHLAGDTAGRYLVLNCRTFQDGASAAEVSGYRLSVEPDQRRFWIGRFDRGQPVALVDWQASSAIRAGQERNHLELTCAGGNVAATANGQTLARVADGTYRGRDGRIEIGVGVLGPSQGAAELRLDNLVVVQK